MILTREYLRGVWARLRYVFDVDPVLHPDIPDHDCTDFAHPAWWRGEEHACNSAARQTMAILEGKHDYDVPPCRWHEARERLHRLVDAARAAGIDIPD